jgi:Holliday junction resolvasome RuvABC DNA-binding subunit
MTTPIAIEVNCETGEVIERPLTAEEIAAQEAAAEQAAADQAQREAEATAKAEAKAQAIAALVALGLTEAQIAALTA